MSVEDFIAKAEKRTAKQAEVTETDIENAYVDYAKRKGCKAIKLILLRKRGWPDRTTLCPGGRVLFIEFKRKGKKPSPNQSIVRRMIEGFGFTYLVCDQKGQAEQALDDFLK